MPMSANSQSPPALSLNDAVTGYAGREIVKGVSLDVYPGELVAIIGHNGSGKSTLLNAIVGLIRLWRGGLRIQGEEIVRASPPDLLRSGVGYLPQGNLVFAQMTVRENLELAGLVLRSDELFRDGWNFVMELYPHLEEFLSRKAGALSGGEKQLVALASTLILQPRILMLDEPSLGLAPPLVSRSLKEIRSLCRDRNVACLLVEQKVREALKVADRVYVLRNGEVSFSGSASALSNEDELRRVYL